MGGRAGTAGGRDDLDIQDGKIVRCDFGNETHAAGASSGRSGCRSSRDGPARDQVFDVMIDGPDTAVTDASGLAAPRWVLPVGGGLGYGLFVLDQSSSITWSAPCTESPIL